ncbi:MAG TPA: galactokinase [Thermogutta sp.]|nr:galactokinase [Thermogutta sp.]
MTTQSGRVDRQTVAGIFHQTFGKAPDIVARGPGRVNLIGEHTDYNDGFVLPMAIDRAIWIALRPRRDRWVMVHFNDTKQYGEFHLDALRNTGEGSIEYVKGVAWALQEEGFFLRGWEGVVVGDVPVGAGLSSSAALEVVTARVFAAVSHCSWDPVKMALLSQRAENRWVGVQCGIMDQLISACGRADHALLIDCRSLEFQHVPLPPTVRVVILDTGTRRGLVDSAYNERRAACEHTAERFRVKALRDISLDEFERRAVEMDETTWKRVRHVISENDRTLRAAEALRQGDVTTFGRLMVESHVSLRDDFEVSSPALDAMVEIALSQPGCLGARMTGAGFGGCAVALVEAETAETFAQNVAEQYRQKTKHEPAVYISRASDGADIVA